MKNLECDGCGKPTSPLKQERVKVEKTTQSGRPKQTIVKMWLCRDCRERELVEAVQA